MDVSLRRARCWARRACWARVAPSWPGCSLAPTRPTPGHLRAGGAPKRFGSPREAIAAGIAFCSEDRKHEGCILELSVRENTLCCRRATACAS